MIHIRLCRRVSDRRVFTRSISGNKTTFYGQRQIDMIFLLQKMTTHFRRHFLHIFRVTKCGKAILLQRATGSYNKVRQLLQSVINFYYTVQQVLQISHPLPINTQPCTIRKTFLRLRSFQKQMHRYCGDVTAETLLFEKNIRQFFYWWGKDIWLKG